MEWRANWEPPRWGTRTSKLWQNSPDGDYNDRCHEKVRLPALPRNPSLPPHYSSPTIHQTGNKKHFLPSDSSLECHCHLQPHIGKGSSVKGSESISQDQHLYLAGEAFNFCIIIFSPTLVEDQRSAKLSMLVLITVTLWPGSGLEAHRLSFRVNQVSNGIVLWRKCEGEWRANISIPPGFLHMI